MTPPPLPKVDMSLPEWHDLSRALRRLDTARSGTGRLATAAGFTAAAVGLFTGDFAGASLLATAALSAAGLASLRLWKPDGQQKTVATVLYLAPGASLAALLVGERIVPGIHWVEALGLAVWTLGVGLVRPARVARRMMSPTPPPAPATDLAPVDGLLDDHPAARWWAEHVAVKGGAAPSTLLEGIERTGEKSLKAVIRSATPGRPVPNIDVKDLSAAMNIPEDLIKIGPVPGRGASVRLLKVGQQEEDRDPASVWASRIAPLAMPGTVLTSVRSGRPAASTSGQEG
ncbi:hypothetical protein [Nonomuraea roseoviolacea]|uniref:Uncharacterized protein n=1 Tax=Nonomuraea roseoviolacea subsp. carminata TaxID=160689 RepID=A0ABT1K9E1_9ACTN|nr:hypothetical protein [Nonomuraea roseoviolacea]MCP2350591.1 hypothetical protein [Nonomuraea roseoviolacea subsp. carminata]